MSADLDLAAAEYCDQRARWWRGESPAMFPFPPSVTARAWEVCATGWDDADAELVAANYELAAKHLRTLAAYHPHTEATP